MRFSQILSIAAVLFAGTAYGAIVAERQGTGCGLLLCQVDFFPDDVNPVKGDAAYRACEAAGPIEVYQGERCTFECQAATDPSGWALIGHPAPGYTCQ